MNVKGAYVWPNGERYQGEFKSTEKSGKGIYSDAEGSKHKGEFEEGKIVEK